MPGVHLRLEQGRFVQYLVSATRGEPALRSVQYRVGFRRANVGSAAVAVVVRMNRPVTEGGLLGRAIVQRDHPPTARLPKRPDDDH